MAKESHKYDVALQEKHRKTKETGRNDEPTKQGDPPEPPPGGARPWEVGQWPTHTCKMPGGQLFEPPGHGTQCRVPSSPRSATLFDVSPSLEGQTTFKF